MTDNNRISTLEKERTLIKWWHVNQGEDFSEDYDEFISTIEFNISAYYDLAVLNESEILIIEEVCELIKERFLPSQMKMLIRGGHIYSYALTAELFMSKYPASNVEELRREFYDKIQQQYDQYKLARTIKK